MESVRAIGMLAACMLLAVSGVSAAREGTEGEDPAVSSKKKSDDPKDIKVLIPSYSKDVSDNGCRVRANPQETFSGPDIDIRHVPFAELISETVGRYSVRAILDAPDMFAATLAPLDADMRTLVLVDVLHDGLGRDGLHTFFFMSAAQHALAIRDALAAAGLKREHELFVRPCSCSARTIRSTTTRAPSASPIRRSTRRSTTSTSRCWRSPARSARATRSPRPWSPTSSARRRCGRRSKPSAHSWARSPACAISIRRSCSRNNLWDKTDAEVVQALASLPTEHRTLLVMDIFNAEFSNGGVHQFFFNSSGAVAPEVYDAFRELGLERQAAIYKRALDMFPGNYLRDMQKRRDKFFSDEWGAWDERLQKLTDDFYALDGGPTLVRLGDKAAVEGGPGIWARHGRLRAHQANAALLQRCVAMWPR